MERSNQELEQLVQRRVENLFATRQLACAEAVLCVLNRGFGGELPDALAVRLASGFPEGMGRSGCLCGALSGAVMALGLFLGRSGPGLGPGRPVKTAVAALQREFKSVYKSSCCRILTKFLVYGSREHMGHCAQISGYCARTAARLLMDARPGLVARADYGYLDHRDSAAVAGFRILTGTWRQAGR